MADSGSKSSSEAGSIAAMQVAGGRVEGAWRKRAYPLLSVAALGVAVSALAGWMVDSHLLRAWTRETTSMNPLTAICFLVAAGILLRVKPGSSLPPSWRIAANFLMLIGAVQLAATYFGLGFRFDQLLFAERLTRDAPVANRMAPNTAIAFFATGAAMLLLPGSERLTRIGQIVLATNFLGVLFALLGYAYNVAALYRVGQHLPMALNTALAFLCISAALACHALDRGLFAPFAAQTIGGQIARRFLPFLLLVPPILGWLRVWGEKHGYYDSPTGSAMMSIIWIVVLVTVVLLTARSMNAADLKRLAAEKALARRMEELQAAQEELESFSYSVSHDLRAPLRHISGFIGLLQSSGSKLDAKAQRYIGIINDSAIQMGRLIDDLLTFSRLGRAELSNGEVDLNVLVAEAVASIEKDEGNRKINWNLLPLPRVQGDGSMLRQVFLNLLQNAAKYTRRASEATIEISSAKTAEGDLVIAVRDNGVGFDMKYADKLFGVFQRLHRPEDFEGTGIGLANVRRVIARHGGKTWAEAKVGAGATFWCSLPRERVIE